MSKAEASTFGLQRIELLKGLSQERVSLLAARCKWRTVPKGMFIVARDSRDRDVHLIVAGRVRATSFSPLGRQVSFREHGAGEMIGELAAIDGRPRSVDVLAVESVLLASMSPETFRELVDEEPLVRDRVLQALAGLVRSLSERVMELSTLGVQNRIHAELLRLARQSGQRGPEARITPPPRHADIASQVSTYREQVTRELSELARQGLLAKEDGALVLRDVHALERMVEEVRKNV